MLDINPPVSILPLRSSEHGLKWSFHMSASLAGHHTLQMWRQSPRRKRSHPGKITNNVYNAMIHKNLHINSRYFQPAVSRTLDRRRCIQRVGCDDAL